MNEITNNKLPELPTGEELEVLQQGPDFLRDDEWWSADITESLLDFDDDLETPEYTIKLNGANVGPVTGVQTIAAQSGHGKTQTMTLLMSAYLGAQIDCISLIWEKRHPRVLYVDTEMEKGNTQLVVARTARLCNCNISDLKERMFVIRLRDEENHVNIWRKILKATWELKPDVLFLDGMIDIIGDFNDNKEANIIIRKVMKVADFYEMPVWAVMHQNPGTTKMTGHQGSFLERKSTVVLMPIKVCDDEQSGIYHFEIKNGKQRGEDVRPLAFHMERFTLPNGDTNAYPVIGKSPALPQEKEQEPDLDAFVRRVIPKSGITTRDLRLAVEKEFKIGHTKADQMMWRLEDEKYLFRAQDKRYFINTDKITEEMFVPEDEDAPF